MGWGKSGDFIRKTLGILIFFLLAGPPEVLGATNAQTFTYQGRFLNPAGTEPLSGLVDVVLAVYSPSGTCLLYEEKQTNLDLTTTSGIFSIQVGSLAGDPKRTSDDPGLSMRSVFSNTGVPLTGASGCSYTPLAGHNRKLRVKVTPHLTGVEVTLSPDQSINSVPQSQTAETLQGLDPLSFIQSANGVSGQDNVNLDNLKTLTANGDASALHHHDSRYVKIGSGGTNANLGSGAYTGGYFGIGTSTPNFDLDFGGNSNRTIQVDRNASGGGSSLTVQGGGAQSGASNQNGGNLTLSSGVATGSGVSAIYFNTASGGSAGSSDSAPSTKMVLSAAGKLGIGVGIVNPAAQLEVDTASANTIGAIIKGFASQVADLFQVRDSANHVLANIASDGSMTLAGALTLPGDPVQPMQACTKQYVDSAIGAMVSGVSSFNTRTGVITLSSADVTTALAYTPLKNTTDTLTGNLTVSGTGSMGGAAGASTQFQSTSTVATNITAVLKGAASQSADLLQFQNSSGSVLSKVDKNGIMTLASNPTSSLEAATKSYVDTVLTGAQPSGNYLTALTGDVSASGPGSAISTVNSVGTSTAANVHSAELLANAATDANTASAIVRRDASGNFSAGTISAANVGVGTTSPTLGKLQVTESTASYIGGIAVVDPTAAHGTYLWSDSTNSYLYSGNGGGPLILNTSGNVGIGTNSPGAKLESVGDAYIGNRTAAGGGELRVYGNNSGTAKYIGLGHSGITAALNISSTDAFVIDDAANSGAYMSFFRNSTAGKNIPMKIFGWDTGTSASAYGQLQRSTTGFEISSSVGPLVLQSGAGNVGIGTTAPGYKLDVNGTINATAIRVAGLNIGLGGGSISTNTATGSSALNVNSTGANNTAQGYNALASNTTGSQNTATGSSALASNTTGYYNTASGQGALSNNTTGYQNTAAGMNALYNNTTGTQNSATGSYALSSNTTGSNNVAVGNAALSANTTANWNTALGQQAMYQTTTGSQNTGIGGLALLANTSGTQNTATGYGALGSITTATGNTASGYQALSANTASYETAFGFQALYSNTTGAGNTGVGVQALYANTTGGGSTAIGYQSLNANTTGYNNVANGYQALKLNTTGYSNTAVGAYVMSANTAGSQNVAYGQQALNGNTTGGANSAIGYGSLVSNSTGNYNNALGTTALYSNTTGYSNNAVGFDALYLNTTGYALNAMGNNALFSNTTGAYNVGIGNSALYSNTTGYANVAVGASALSANTTSPFNTAIGHGALSASTGATNTAVGAACMQANTTGSYNTAMGFNTLVSNTTGSNNTAFGLSALQNLSTGSSNIALGHSALIGSQTANSNIAIGVQAMYANTSGGSNIAIGTGALYNDSTGTGNIVIGNSAGNGITTGSNNVIIGPVGASTTTSNNIILADGSGNQRINVDSNGNVGIGTSSPGARLDITGAGGELLRLNSTGQTPQIYFSTNGNTHWAVGTGAGDGSSKFEFYTYDKTATALAIDAISGNVGIGISTPSEALEVNGNVKGTAFLSTSDRRLKTDIATLEHAEELVKKLRGVNFKWKKDGKSEIGLIAQEVEEVIPALVVTDPVSGLKSVKYANMVALLIEGNKQQEQRIQELESRSRTPASISSVEVGMPQNVTPLMAMLMCTGSIFCSVLISMKMLNRKRASDET